MSTTQIERNTPVSEETFDQLFRQARTHFAWQDRPVSDEIIRELYDLTKMGPTAANGGHGRFVFVKSEEAKARLLTGMAEGNQEKTRTAPVTVIVAYDTRFHDQLPKLFPIYDMRPFFEGNAPAIEEHALRNSSLQGAYLILAARALGLDAGPMSGFDAEKINAEFFPDGQYKVNFIVNLGYGDESQLFPRLPRLDFEEAAQIL